MADTGKFFGEVRGYLMRRLIAEKVYQAVKINDYQAVCFQGKNDGSPASILETVRIFFLKLIKKRNNFFSFVANQTYFTINSMDVQYLNLDVYQSFNTSDRSL